MKKIFIISCLILGLFGLWQIKLVVFAETSGSSPESGADSRIQAIYDSLVSLSHGLETAGSWGDWGAWWNRIRSAAEWLPGGDANAGDVKLDKTFYKDSRTQQTGTLSLTGDATTSDVGSGKTFYGNSFTQQTGTADIYYFENQSLVEYDDYEYGESLGAGDTGTEESSWSNPATNVWKDNRTGLYWSNRLDQQSNIFPDQDHTACPFFSKTDRGSYEKTDDPYTCGVGGNESCCGNAINTCADLELEIGNGGLAETDWYLPSQKELMQAYIDGMYNKAGSAFTTTSYFWSSTEFSASSACAWYVYLSYGYTNFATKISSTDYVRCVRRD